MKYILSIFGFIWAIWVITWFLIIVIPFTIIYAVVLGVFGKKYVEQCIWINCHYLSPIVLTMALVRVKRYGAEKIDPKRVYVFVANHRALIDTLVAASSVPHPVRFLAKAEIKYIPFFGFMTKMLAIMVDRKSKESRERSMLYLANELGIGRSIFIFPEGTRNRTPDAVKEFKDGAFRAAIMGQVPIAVQSITGTRQVNNPKGLQFLPGTVEVHWSDPIETKGMTLDDLEKLKDLVRNEMTKHLEK